MTQFFARFQGQGRLGDGTIAELSRRYQVRPNMISKWKREALSGLKENFGTTRQFVIEGGWDITPTNSVVFWHINTFHDNYWRFGYLRVVRQGLDIFVLFDKEPAGDAALSLNLLRTIS